MVESTSSSARRVLVVDDDEDIHTFVKSTFGETYELEHVLTIADARDKLDDDVYDLVLLDHSLPDGTGIDLLDEVRAGTSPNKSTAVVMLTATKDAEVYESSWGLGSTGYVMKPIDFHKLADAMSTALVS